MDNTTETRIRHQVTKIAKLLGEASVLLVVVENSEGEGAFQATMIACGETPRSGAIAAHMLLDWRRNHLRNRCDCKACQAVDAAHAQLEAAHASRDSEARLH